MLAGGESSEVRKPPVVPLRFRYSTVISASIQCRNCMPSDLTSSENLLLDFDYPLIGCFLGIVAPAFGSAITDRAGLWVPLWVPLRNRAGIVADSGNNDVRGGSLKLKSQCLTLFLNVRWRNLLEALPASILFGFTSVSPNHSMCRLEIVPVEWSALSLKHLG